jgi:tetratricopeptide (TPR) repeat protein
MASRKRGGSRSPGAPAPSGEEGERRRDRLGPVLRWVAAATAVLSLAFALKSAGDMISTARAKQRQVTELLQTAALQQSAGDHEAAWTTLGLAADADPDHERVRTAREDAGMLWLENVRVRQGERTFADVVGLVAPVLARGATLASGSRRADLLAHLGWADFLRGRENAQASPPDRHYREALASDPANVYAHTMLGHWIAWQRGDPGEVDDHFALALATGREGAYVRRMQFAAIRNLGGETGDLRLIRLALDLRRSAEPLEEGWPREFLDAYERQLRSPCRDQPRERGLSGSLPAATLEQHAEALAWLRGLLPAENPRGVAGHLRACVLEADGQFDAALLAYQQARTDLSASSVHADAAERGIERLSPMPDR